MNNKLLKLIKEYPVLAGDKKRDALDELLSYVGIEEDAFAIVFGENQRAVLRFLADAARRKKSYTILKPLVIKKAGKLTKIEDDKARKVAFVLIGECAAQECADILYKALQNEKTRFVRPSIILALGNTDDPKKYLSDYVIEPGEQKHTAQESIALKKALADTVIPAKNISFNLPQRASITFIKKSALISELTEKNISYKERGEHLIDVPSKALESIRCYEEALYYLDNIKEIKNIAIKLNEMGCRGSSYRIEAGKYPPQQRAEIIKRISSALADYGYYDNPSAYSFEIRAMRNGVLFAVFPQKDRFPYRIKTISASINPVTAASVMQVCKQYMSKNANVIDPFCGSATMLIERALAMPYKSLVGIDKSSVAIKAALANRKAADIDISLIKKDILDFDSMQFDEIISNMPFGNRVSGHESNKTLYMHFIQKLDSLLSSEGTAMLYTQEKKLLRDNIEKNGNFIIIEEEMFDSGGLYPTLFIIKRKLIV